jgi:hypothetical protein
MDIVTNYAVGEEAVGAIFGGDQDKGSARMRNPRAPIGAPRGATGRRRRRTSRASTKLRLTTLSLPLTARSLEDPLVGAFSTKCSKNHVPTIRDP